MTSKTLTDAAPDFVPFPKIHRLFRDIIITEKLDGTNAQVVIDDLSDASEEEKDMRQVDSCFVFGPESRLMAVRAASRNRYVLPENDNFGFAAWVYLRAEELAWDLGVGRHFGEWWGKGIQRGYGLSERRFSLFNVSRWSDATMRPECCDVVPILYEGEFESQEIRETLADLRLSGSIAAPGFMQPEGIVVYHTQGNALFKATLDGDGHKGTAR